MASGGKSTQGNKSWETTTQSGQTGLDAQTEAWRRQVMEAAQGAGGAGNPLMNQGVGAMTGGANPFMNPYQQQVIDQLNKQYEVGSQMANRATNDAATRAGAFGGSRHGVAAGVAQGQVMQNRDMQMANLLNQGFEGSMDRARWAAEQGSQGLGDPNAYRLGMLGRGFQAFGGLHGTNYSGTGGRTNTGLQTRMNFGWGMGGG